jgi:hypothetical protein
MALMFDCLLAIQVKHRSKRGCMLTPWTEQVPSLFFSIPILTKMNALHCNSRQHELLTLGGKTAQKRLV